ncbi:ESAT-6 protein secretion system EspG family protein [Herbihabitans rhizosphaerae]|uniref:ESAT-6 protein secretion system EspG family protein n=1 Tax=Herbihabitans rhizosphaerae TaxID=1872711 RepID=A0A4Q7KYT1_9PSEU|nr:ESX secretion-associated protein EspG [Herbihabitans rhizosphaerae]RZS41221.1 ESAT-6 protein secretion system EspG family protein [Herbihabitans rhizosphaerae]
MTDGEHLSPIELDFLWETLDGGELPYPLESRSHGTTMEERDELRQQVRAQLVQRRLLNQDGELGPHVETWLSILVRPQVSVDSVFLPELDGVAVCSIAALAGGNAVLAVQDDEGLRIRPVHATGLASAVVELLPEAERGTEQSISLPAEELTAVAETVSAGQVSGPTARPGRGRGVTDTREALLRLTGRRSHRGGQIAANSRGNLGGRKRTPVLAWFDNDTGRYLSQARSGADGRDWVTVAPADAATLRHRISEMITAITQER